MKTGLYTSFHNSVIMCLLPMDSFISTYSEREIWHSELLQHLLIQLTEGPVRETSLYTGRSTQG